MGLQLFRESFLHAFAYLLSPSLGIGNRPVYYPPLDLRAKRLADAARDSGIAVEDDYPAFFDADTIPALSRADEFRVEVADEALTSVVDRVRAEAANIVAKARIEGPSAGETDRILERFRRAVPAERCASMTALLNAGWAVFLDPSFWPPDLVSNNRRDEVLRELVLKNFEIFEIEHIQQSETP